jgi:hypothetical protein
MSNLADGAPEARTSPETGYADVNGLQMYYEVHGSGGTPLVLLHGGLFKDTGVPTTSTDHSHPPIWPPTSLACCSTWG